MSNGALIHKEDGALWIFIDFYEYNSRTARDAYFLPRIKETNDTLAIVNIFV